MILAVLAFQFVVALQWILGFVAIAFLVPTFMLMTQCVTGSFPRRKDVDGDHRDNSGVGRPSVDVLIPAHNEESVITATILSIQSQLRAGDRMLVIADNCTDDTAAVARALGADVTERFNDTQRAKGFAVDHGLKVLESDSRDVVLMVDADCDVSNGSVDRLARLAIETGSPVQANYQMPAASRAGSWGAVSGFATTVKNQVRPLGLHRLGYGCVLYGSGMAFPSKLARRPNWASDNIVEDMKVSYDLMIEGHSPRYCPEAIVRAGLPEARDNALEQRKRWEHGHLHTIATQSPRLIGWAMKTARPSLLVAAIDLLIPPLALLVQCWVIVTLAILVITWTTSISWIPLAIMTVAGFNLAIGVMTAWYAHGRDQLSIRQLCTIPFYILSKLPLYVSAIFRRQRTWRRTDREPSHEATV
ncbi:Poly-beta-1,6-N-acetyl-D-glucosamine synthase [Rubripirellula tenax]|uniref:Poly-beta-1,6-N-acetyl-D-glucosamine synthase n=1 Tax=Rubripirellula tenax TaxID=2528015 RepID=A0A5C6F8Z2_9BACT|nr:glycosyltransferase family 2 protein [Rubripirellula tenax]TWU56877.1 Poly-beta-1,6-N-acetyl-D-glucosamine synthase [Rubripirellula tenax]